MASFIDHLVARKSATIYVIIFKNDLGKLDLLADPGLNKPWHTENKRLADFHAGNVGGEARTWAEAFALLLKDNPKFEKDLYERLEKRDVPGAGGVVGV